jgi:hypothetical protein
MPRTCAICQHPSRADIDKVLAAGTSYRNIAKQHNVSPQAMFRHKDEHIPATLAKAEAAKEVARADTLLEQVQAGRARRDSTDLGRPECSVCLTLGGRTLAHDVTTVVNASGHAGLSSQCTEVAHTSLSRPQKGVCLAVGGLAFPYDSTLVVDSVGPAALGVTAERTQVGDPKSGTP